MPEISNQPTSRYTVIAQAEGPRKAVIVAQHEVETHGQPVAAPTSEHGGEQTHTAGQTSIGGETHTGTEAHGGEHGGEHGGTPLTHHPALQYTFSGLAIMALIAIWAVNAGRNLQKVPGRGQAFAETVVEGLTNFTRTSIGPGGEKFVPLIGSLFIYILVSNLSGNLPVLWAGKKPGEVEPFFYLSPMGNISMTFALAFIVFCVVQYTAIKEQGVVGRLKHLAGPVPAFAPLIFLIELVGELVRPLSLSVRLFGNIFGEEMIVAVLIGLLALLPIPLPLHLPILVFGLLTAVVQAGVFCLLSCVYLQLAMDHGHGEEHGHGDDGGLSHAPATAH